MDQASVVILVFNAFSNFEKDYNHFRLLTDTQSMKHLIHSKIARCALYGKRKVAGFILMM